jgi:ribonuclease HI
MGKKSYVVYNGRKNGVYTSWVDCYAQANGYTDCVVRLYDSVRDGEEAWNSYRLNCTSSLQTKRNIEDQIFNGSGYMSNILSNIVDQAG